MRLLDVVDLTVGIKAGKSATRGSRADGGVGPPGQSAVGIEMLLSPQPVGEFTRTLMAEALGTTGW